MGARSQQHKQAVLAENKNTMRVNCMSPPSEKGTLNKNNTPTARISRKRKKALQEKKKRTSRRS